MSRFISSSMMEIKKVGVAISAMPLLFVGKNIEKLEEIWQNVLTFHTVYRIIYIVRQRKTS